MIDEPIYPNCGTYAGAMKHAREKTPKCDECKRAARQYKRRWRTDDDKRAVEREDGYARDRALRKLAANHRDEYLSLVKIEKAKK